MRNARSAYLTNVIDSMADAFSALGPTAITSALQSDQTAWRRSEVLPGPNVTDEATLRVFLSRNTGTYFHPVGSCAMGTGPDAVVDPELRVHGLTGLRVADASVMPRIPPVNTNAATIMIGGKAADLIRS